jgi:hypothetical protein
MIGLQQHSSSGISPRTDPVMKSSNCPRSVRPSIVAAHLPISEMKQKHGAFSTAPPDQLLIALIPDCFPILLSQVNTASGSSFDSVL